MVEAAFPNVASASGNALVARKLGFDDMPAETQKGILKYLPRRDLPAAQRVSRHFHSLASKRLYESLEFTITHPDAASYYSKPGTRMADALHTIATSEQNYGQFVQSFALEMSDHDAEDVQRRILSKYHYEEDATRYLNSMLLLLLQQSKGLETFVWIVSIELSGYIYQALSKMESLVNLRIRLDTAMVFRTASFTIPHAVSHHHGHNHHPPVPPNLGVTINHTPSFTLPAFPPPATPSAHNAVSVFRKQKANPHMLVDGWRKFSLFSHLRTLQITGIDELSRLEEIKHCIANSYTTLKALTLSLSHDLTRKARKPFIPPPPPPPQDDSFTETDSDASDPTIDLQHLPAFPQPSAGMASATVTTHPTSEAEIRKQKADQETVLAKIFGLEDDAAQSKKIDNTLKIQAAAMKSKETPMQLFMESIKTIMIKMRTSEVLNARPVQEKFVADLLEQAAEKYMSMYANRTKGDSKQGTKTIKIDWSKKIGLPDPNDTPPGWVSAYYQFVMSGGSIEDLLSDPTLINVAMPHNGEGGNWVNPAFGSGPSTQVLGGLGANNISQSQAYEAYLNSHHAGGASSNAPLHYHPHSGGVHPPPNIPLSTAAKKQLYKDNFDWLVNTQKVVQQNKAPEISGDDESDDCDSIEKPTTPDLSQKTNFFPAAELTKEERDLQEMGVDMEHPDELDGSDEEDDMNVDGYEESRVPTSQDPCTDLDSLDMEMSGIMPGGPSATAGPSTTAAVSANVPTQAIDTDARNHRIANTIAGLGFPTADDSGSFGIPNDKTSIDKIMEEYIWKTHGIRLELLEIYLIPLKASIIFKAVDVKYLQHITLLDVGPQAGFWTMFGRLASETRLTSIHTDDVSVAFLDCVGRLRGLRDLFLLKRNAKLADYAASKNAATLTDLRLTVLRRHMGSLQRLSIANKNDYSWDLDARCLRLICVKGTNLKELAISVNIKDYHILMQNMAGLKSLIALHILSIRTDDHCTSIARECRRFTVDNITHCPTLKIKYLAMQGQVYKLIRKANSVEKPRQVAKDAKGKGKGKAAEFDMSEGDESGGNSEGFDEIETAGLEMASVRTMNFADIEGVRIFVKDIRVGKL